MLSTEETRVEEIWIGKNPFNKSSKEDQFMIEKYLQELHSDSLLLHTLILSDCQLTDDLLLPIVNVLKFVKKLDLCGKELTFKSLYTIFKVSFFKFLLTLKYFEHSNLGLNMFLL